MQSGSTPRNHEARIAASGLLTFALATLAFAATGFGFMFGGIGTVLHSPDLSRFVTYYTLPIGAQSWNIIGLRGFLLNDVSEPGAIELFVTYLPLAITCAMLPAKLALSKTGFVGQAILTLFLAGLLFPLLGFWLWSGGWPAGLGLNLNLGHGAVDLCGLTTAALVAGGAGLALLMFTPRQEDGEQITLPVTQYPFRSLSGLVITLVGVTVIASNNPLLGTNAERIAIAMFLNGGIAISAAVIVAFLYTVITTQKTDLSSAARAALGALIAIAGGGVLLPTWVAIIAGIFAGLLATFGLYIANHWLHRSDDAGMVSGVLIPGILGALLIGLFANGVVGQGFNGIGDSEYLAIANLGITGMFSMVGAPGDAGQMTAQVILALIAPTTAFILFAPLAKLLIYLPTPQQHEEASPVIVHTTSFAAPEPAPTYATEVEPLAASTPLAAQPADLTPELASPSIIVRAEDTVHPLVDSPFPAPTRSNEQTPDAQPQAPEEKRKPRKETLLERLRRARNGKQEPERPVQPRHVAYPNRVAGRRLSIRPMPDDSNTTENGKPAR
jgi:Amt family ammonium transporter